VKLLLIAVLVLGVGGTRLSAEQRTGEIFVISSSGGAKRVLTSTPARHPSLSPDGHLIAFDSGEIHVMNVDGSGQRNVGTATGERPQWAPDGRRLVYTSWNDSGCYPGPAQKCAVTEVWTVNVDGSANHKVLDKALHPAWSPNGRRLLFRDFVGPAEAGMPVGALKVAWTDGSHVRTLSRKVAATDGEFNPPAWSPNGKWIAFDATAPTKRQEHRLFLVRPDGSHLHLLTTGMFPAWSPNGKSIAFERAAFRPYRVGIWIVPAAGGRARRVSALGQCPAWSADGRRIAFLTDKALGVVRADGRGRQLLAAATDCDHGLTDFPSPPVWSRDGREIYFIG
jgi:Tol biopolymer transport system component